MDHVGKPFKHGTSTTHDHWSPPLAPSETTCPVSIVYISEQVLWQTCACWCQWWLVSPNYVHAHVVTWESHTLRHHDTYHAMQPVLQPATLYKQLFDTYPYHCSLFVVILKWNCLVQLMAVNYHSTDICNSLCYKHGQTQILNCSYLTGLNLMAITTYFLKQKFQ